MEDVDDDFGELYADVELQTSSSTITAMSSFSQLYLNHQHNNESGVDERRDNSCGLEGSEKKDKDSETGNNVNDEVEVENSSDSDDDDDDDDDDDFDVVVNDEDFEAKNGGGDGRRCCEEVPEDKEAEFVVEGNSIRKNQLRIDSDGVEQSGGGGGGGEKGSVTRNGCNSQYKYLRRYSSVFAGTQRAMSLWKADREDGSYGQPRMAGFVPGLAGNGNCFWLPWYRSILDVDIDTFEQKCWTHPGADITDYFNFSFDEESWRNYCQSLDQLRQQTFNQTRNQVSESLGFKLENEAGSTRKRESKGLIDGEKMASHESDFATRQFKKQFGQAIHVEDSNIERQPSTDARRPRNRDSDVVIEITVQDPVEPSSSGNEELHSTIENQCKMSEKECDHAERPGGSKAYEMAKISVEENVRSSSVSSDRKRSYESVAVSSHMRQKCKMDIQASGKENIFSTGNSRAIKTHNSSTENVDYGSDTTETNPCVAGIDLAFDDHVRSDSSPSCANTWSEVSKDDYHCDSKRIRVSRRSSSDSMKQIHQVAEVDSHRLRRKRDDKISKERGGKCRLRVRNDEDSKHTRRRPRRHLELKNHRVDDNLHRIGNAERRYGVSCSRTHRHRSDDWCLASDDEYWHRHRSDDWCLASDDEYWHRHRSDDWCLASDDEYWHRHSSDDWCLASDDEYWPNRENKSSLGCYDRRSVDYRFLAENTKDFHCQEHWGSRDEVDMYFQREWDEDHFYPDRKLRRLSGLFVQKDWRLQERECVIRDEKPFLQNRQHVMLKFSSSRDIKWHRRQREYDDVHFNDRSKHGRLLPHNSDGSVHNRHARPNPFYDRRSKYRDLEMEHERSLWHFQQKVETSGRGDEYFESPLDVDSRYIVDDDEYCKGKTFTSTRDYRDELPMYGESRHQNTFYIDDTDDPPLYQNYERYSSSISAKNDTDGRQVYDGRDTCSRHDAARYLDDDDYFENSRNVFQSNGMRWSEDTLFDGCFDNGFCDGNMMESLKGVPRHKLHGVKDGCARMAIRTQIVKGRFGSVSNGSGKPYSKISTRAKHEEIGLQGRNEAELLHTVRNRKSTRMFSKAGTRPKDDACEHANGRFGEQFRRQQKQDEGFPEKMEDETLKFEGSRDEQLLMNHGNVFDLEEGQIPTEEPSAEILKVKKYGSGSLAQKDTQRGQSSLSQKVGPTGDRVYDENRILETMAKMEKRRERFKESVLLKKDSYSAPKPEVDYPVLIAESKVQRPMRKRKWGGS